MPCFAGDAAIAQDSNQGGPGPKGVRGPRTLSEWQQEDVPGVPCAAWVRVTRGTPPAEPFTPGASNAAFLCDWSVKGLAGLLLLI